MKYNLSLDVKKGGDILIDIGKKKCELFIYNKKLQDGEWFTVREQRGESKKDGYCCSDLLSESTCHGPKRKPRGNQTGSN